MKNNEKKAAEAARFMDNLASFMANDDLKGQELLDDLRAKGLDPEKLERDFRDLLSKHAPTWQQLAERERKAALKMLPPGGRPRVRAEVQAGIQDTILAMQRLGSDIQAGAYHQKFREATDADLESLLQDLEAQYEGLKGKKENG